MTRMNSLVIEGIVTSVDTSKAPIEVTIDCNGNIIPVIIGLTLNWKLTTGMIIRIVGKLVNENGSVKVESELVEFSEEKVSNGNSNN